MKTILILNFLFLTLWVKDLYGGESCDLNKKSEECKKEFVTVETSIISRYSQAFIRFYQKYGSKFLRSRCSFYPSCSRYALECLNKYTPLKAILSIINRLQRCNPWNTNYYFKIFKNNRWLNYDPVD